MKDYFSPNACLKYFQLTCECSQSFKEGAFSGFSCVMDGTGPHPTEDSSQNLNFCNQHPRGVLLLQE